MSKKPPLPSVIPPATDAPDLGPLIVVEGDCAYFRDGRRTRTAFALPGPLKNAQYQRAMDIGMRRSGTVIYRPLCDGCRRCQPMRIPVADFKPSKSQRRARNKCKPLFDIEVTPSAVDDERVALYARYQQAQHGERPQDADWISYQRFLVDSIADTIEMCWRDKSGKLVGVGILDVTSDALSSVYFYWDPDLKHLSLGIYSALVEIETCRAWGKPYYYLGYLVPGSKSMAYKAAFSGAEIWTGNGWRPLGARDVEAPKAQELLRLTQKSAMAADERRFLLKEARQMDPKDFE